MKKLVLSLVACLGLAGCSDSYYTTAEYPTPVAPATSCVMVADDYGEREVCNTKYYYTANGLVYWDNHFGVWIGPGGYWSGGHWFRGYYPGWHGYYHRGLYHAHGYSHGSRFESHGAFHGPRGGGFNGHGGHR